MKSFSLILLCGILCAASCSSPTSSQCDANQAYNKMLALGKVQARLVAKGGASGVSVAGALAAEAAPVSELIAQQKYNEACTVADEIAKKHGIDLANEQKDMLTIEQLSADGGKGTGTCSVADAAKKQMEVHALLQAAVNSGSKGPEIFQQFNEDTKAFGEMIATNPSEACKLLDGLKEKYGV